MCFLTSDIVPLQHDRKRSNLKRRRQLDNNDSLCCYKRRKTTLPAPGITTCTNSAKKSVRFSDSIIIVNNDNDGNDANSDTDIWYVENDYETFQRNVATSIQTLVSSSARNENSHETMPTQEEDCLRGLENYLFKDLYFEFKKQRKMHVQNILQIQHYLRHKQISLHDQPNLIAKQSMNFSEQAQKRAYLIANI